MISPVIKSRSEHPISRSRIDPDVIKVLYRLHNAGFKGYLVGGSVRDLLLGRKPKDFDVGTDAHPHQVKRLFRNCRIIGRRFRLAHIFFSGGKTIEVSTFRKRPEPADSSEGVDLLLTEDNTFGTPVEDALRRDFTINGMFYDIATYSVIDNVSGLTDLHDQVLRVIGDPDIRFREDPVRMLRAVEFAARLDFTLTLDTYDAIVRHRKEISRSSAPRVTEEILGILRGPRPLATFRLLREVGLLEILLPELVAAIAAHTDPDAGEDGTLFWKYLAALEERAARAQRTPDDTVLLGLLFLPLAFSAISARIKTGGKVENADLLLLLEDIVNPIALRLTLPNAAMHTVKQAIFILGKLDEPIRSAATARRLLARNYFSTALELFKIHAVATGRHQEAVTRWEKLRLAPVDPEPRGTREPVEPEPRTARAPAAHETAAKVSEEASPESPSSAAPRRRRRGKKRPVKSDIPPDFRFQDQT